LTAGERFLVHATVAQMLPDAREVSGTHRPALAAASGPTRALITEMLCRPNAHWI
jgi:hypothetical protein